MGRLDLIIFVAYLAVIRVAGVLARRSSPDQRRDAEGFFLGNRSLGWLTVAGSLFATNISSLHFVALAADGYRNGMASAIYELGGVLGLVALALFFAPRYLRSPALTLPDYLQRRFGGAAQLYLAFFSLAMYALLIVPVSLYSGGVIMETIGGWTKWGWMVAIGGICFAYTMAGGLRAVAFADLAQTVIMLIGGAVLCAVSIGAVGGLDGLLAQTEPARFHVLRAADDPIIPWPGALLGVTTIGLWYWGTDQLIVQRVMSARNLTEAQKGALGAGPIKILGAFMFIVPGLCAAILYPAIDPNAALPTLIDHLLPDGVRGLLLVAIVAALMSTVDGAINTSATLIAVDVYPRLRRPGMTRDPVWVGQMASLGLMVLSVGGVILVDRQPSIFTYAQTIAATLAPPVFAMFLFAFWGRTGRRGVSVCVVGGTAVGLGLLLWGPWHFLVHAGVTLAVSLLLGIVADRILGGERPARPLDDVSRAGPPWRLAPIAAIALLLATALCLVVLDR